MVVAERRRAVARLAVEQRVVAVERGLAEVAAEQRVVAADAGRQRVALALVVVRSRRFRRRSRRRRAADVAVAAGVVRRDRCFRPLDLRAAATS